jgi:hypothetical protein
MTTYTGVIQPFLKNGGSQGATTSKPMGTFPIRPRSSWLTTMQAKAGAATKTFPRTSYPRAFNGSYLNGISDFFYYRIIIEPGSLDIGNLLNEQVRQITVWNGYLFPKDVDAVGLDVAAGMELIEPFEAPYTLRPLQAVKYQLKVGVSGPPVINSVLSFDIDGTVYVVPVRGRRVLVFAIPPNWTTSPVETLEWKTSILRSHDGTEQRRELRRVPRRGMEYDFLVKDRAAALLDKLLQSWQNRIYAVPVWWDKAESTADANAGATTVMLSTRTYGFVVGQLAVMYKDTFNYEAVEIVAVNADSIELDQPLGFDWPAGSLVYPIVQGHLPERISFTRVTNTVQTGRVTFETDPSTTDAYLPVKAATNLYEGLEVITRQPNWRDNIENEFSFSFDTLDTGLGAVQWQAKETYPRLTKQHAWLLRDREQMLAFREMLGRMKGMQKVFWVPSWHADITLALLIPAGDTSMAVVGTEFNQLIGSSIAFNRLMIRMKDGSTYYRRILTTGEANGNSIINMEASFPFEVAPDQVLAIHLLLKCRMAGDKIEIPWRTDAVAEPTTAFITVPS